MKPRTILAVFAAGALCGGGGVAGGYLLGHHQRSMQVTLTAQEIRRLARAESGAVDAGITNYVTERCAGSSLNAVRDPFCADQLGG